LRQAVVAGNSVHSIRHSRHLSLALRLDFPLFPVCQQSNKQQKIQTQKSRPNEKAGWLIARWRRIFARASSAAVNTESKKYGNDTNASVID
jgi:hypothetical protein